MKQKIQTLLVQLNHGLVEREATLKTALLTVLAGENLVLIGPPGTGKSLIARRIAESFSHHGNHNKNGYFEYLLTKFSTPEEIFGPLSITELKADRFKRSTTGYLPAVKMAFLDEIFKASSSILNALLTILNERIYHNGSELQAVPLQALIAASNELPTDQEELSALYDRFLVRGFVDYVSQDNLPRLFEKAGAMPALSQLTAADLDTIQRNAESVTLPPEIAQAMLRIWTQHKETFKEDRRESLSDRRLKKVIKLLCVSAATNGRSEVDLSDVLLLKDCLWNHQENAIKVRDLILKTLQSFSRPIPKDGSTHDKFFTDTKTNANLNNLVKSNKGRGTEQNPLLIHTIEDLMDLSHPDIGLGGYYFRQTNNIDCTALGHWMEIPFKGHYDGGSNVITYEQGQQKHSLFSVIKAQSNVRNLNLKNLWLTSTAEDSHITHCLSNVGLINGNVSNCSITACESRDSLIYGTAINCTITACESGNSLIDYGSARNCRIIFCKSNSILIYDTAINCTIRDCLVTINYNGNKDEYCAGISRSLTQSSVVERCFVTGRCDYKGSDFFYFSGITSNNDASIIRQCALGKFDTNSMLVAVCRLVQNSNNSSRFENNASIDSNYGADEINGKCGKTVSVSLFKQRYFEHTLGWDFDTVWQWDTKEDRPALRSVGFGAASQQAQPSAQKFEMMDLLTQQIYTNLWL